MLFPKKPRSKVNLIYFIFKSVRIVGLCFVRSWRTNGYLFLTVIICILKYIKPKGVRPFSLIWLIFIYFSWPYKCDTFEEGANHGVCGVRHYLKEICKALHHFNILGDNLKWINYTSNPLITKLEATYSI